MIGKKKKAAFYTLGCKVNFCETEALQALFEKNGYAITDFDREADVYVINTCTVTGLSDHKSRKMIRRARRRNPDAIIVATGCYAQGAPEELKSMEQLDLVVGTTGRDRLPQVVETLRRGCPVDLVQPYSEENAFEILPPVLKRGRTRGFLNIQQGCDQRCAYCIVPRVRGPLRSLEPQEALKRVRALLRAGCREIVLTGIHLGLYGADLQNVTLAGLLREMESLPGLLRLRLSSLEPGDITGELVEQIAGSEVICPHLHIPLQSGDEEILKQMNRTYTPEEYLYLVQWLRQEIPGLAVSTDLIVGFPGESETHHRRSMELVRKAGFSRLHVFKFSPRPGTPAAGFSNQVPQGEKEKRSREMISLGHDLAASFLQNYLDSEQQVLVEKVIPDAYGEGFTPQYFRARVVLKGKGRRWRGKLLKVRLNRMDDAEQIIWGTPVRQT
ncbi:MAG: tRNA (N(6)-L-threonylcarbamoyladenosine(37)-C(2))-methylthiotransferase MtaB [Dethiobacter sp.]|jgi:threonylcarbamoyladenosine tRNA methylthiotransferase MtaB|nr:tRNA (N(6)-L-threonylcarbamoyladenosine(37)-C(2))-methylthiotransferase MtaB [Dethiobacter sp.]